MSDRLTVYLSRRVADGLERLVRHPGTDERTAVAMWRASAWTSVAMAVYGLGQLGGVLGDVAPLALLGTFVGGLPWLILAGERAVLWWHTRHYRGDNNDE